jgi:RimJ/RimL family protein N-acetyltransferase
VPGAIFLEGEKINLRTIEEEDVEFLRDGINNPAVGKSIGSDFKPRNKSAQKEFFEEKISSGDEVHLAISVDEEMKGIISIIPRNDSTGKIGLWIAEEFHDKGYGTEASKLMIEYAFNELRYHRILARAIEENKASNRIWQKLGFTEEGAYREHVYRKGHYEDLKLYGLLKEEWSGD